MKTPLLLSAALAATLLSSSADTYKLKDGRTYEGKIAMTLEDSYILLVEVQPGVRDEITVKKSDIDEIIKEDRSLAAFTPLTKLLPTADMLSAEDYQRIIDRQIAPFLKKYPKSTHLEEVKKIEATLLAEQDKVKNGSIKLNGKWIDQSAQSGDKYEFEARNKALEVKKLAKSGNYGAALTKLSEMEKAYKNTKPYREALDMGLRLLPVYKAKAQEVVANADRLIEKRDKSLERLPSADKARVKRILAAEEAQYQADLSKASASRGKWLPLNRFHKKEAASVIKRIDKEIVRLQKIADSEFIDAGASYREVLEAIDKNDLETAKLKLREFTKARPPREHSNFLKEQYTKAVEEQRLIERQKKQEEAEERRKAEEDKKAGKESDSDMPETEEEKRKAEEAKLREEERIAKIKAAVEKRKQEAAAKKSSKSSSIKERNKLIEELSQ